MITDVFVYGTLQRGQCRGMMWPRQPLAVRTAYVRGQLYDLGPYPALRCDDPSDFDWVTGELWSFTAEDMSETIAELDRIEETNPPGGLNLYDRCLIRAHRSPNSPQSILALAYQYSVATALPADVRIRSQRGPVIWPAAERVPREF